ncbi:hypothetical protein M5K25_000243 [Dendrobium thyrsiflorum]|uniref:Uncharacterized protein n=1 Tax=Dendrobium thyrsiflorum TaxID=117978 RepID=A0ABD0VT63_DENTH
MAGRSSPLNCHLHHHNPPSSPRQACMVDPDVDHGFIYDDQGRTDVLKYSFFDVHFRNDDTTDKYIDRILYQVTLSIEEHIPPGRWYLVFHPPTSSDSATSPTTTTLGIACLLVALLSQLGTVTQQIRDTQGELTDFRRQTRERLDNIERFGHPVIFTPSRPHSPYGEDNRTKFGPPRDHYHPNPRPN